MDLLQVFFFFLILHNERGQEVHEHFVSCFSRKKSHLGQFNILRPFLLFDWMWSKLIQAAVTFESLNSQDMISQVNVDVMDILWIFCDVYVLGRSVFNRGLNGFVKKLLYEFAA